MYKYLLQSAEGVQYFGIAALITFLVVFVYSAVRAYSRPKSEMDDMASIPLLDETTQHT